MNILESCWKKLEETVVIKYYPNADPNFVFCLKWMFYEGIRQAMLMVEHAHNTGGCVKVENLSDKLFEEYKEYEKEVIRREVEKN